MVDKVINDFTVDLPAFGDGMLYQEGGLPSGTNKRLLPESLNQLFLGNKIIPVYQESDIGTAVSGELTLADNTTYHILAPRVTPNTWILGNNTTILDPSYTQNPITFVGPVGFKSPDLGSVQINNIQVFSAGTTQLFDINSASGGFLSMDRVIMGNLGALGNLNGISTVWQRILIQGFTQGLTLAGGGLLAVDFSLLQTTADTAIFSLSDTFLAPTTLTSLSLATGAGGFGVSLDLGLQTPVLRMRDIELVGGTMFDPAGLNGTEVNFQVSGLNGVKDSEVVGAMSMSGNSTVTNIINQGDFESIGGTTAPGSFNERITHAGNILTYIGVEPANASVHAVMTATAISGTSLCAFRVFKNNVLVPDAISVNDIGNRASNTSLQFIVPLVTDDTIEIKIANTESSTNITVSDMIVTLQAAA